MRAAVIILESWQKPNTRLCMSQPQTERRGGGESERVRFAEKEKREREQFGRKQRKTTGAAGRELLSSADYQNKLAFVSTS